MTLINQVTSLPAPHKMELLHRAFVHAVVANAGASAFQPNPDNGADLGIGTVRRMPDGTYRNTGYQLYCQLKATTVFEINSGYVVYDMEADAYNKLVGWEGVSPCILILYCMPKASQDWLSSSDAELTLRRCCYWMHIKGSPTSNTSTIRVRIPQQNVFNADAVPRLLDAIRQQCKSIDYDLK